jgi:hypothetical protein
VIPSEHTVAFLELEALPLIETDESDYALAGNASLIVDRRDGSIHETSTAEPIEPLIATLEPAPSPLEPEV